MGRGLIPSAAVQQPEKMHPVFPMQPGRPALRKLRRAGAALALAAGAASLPTLAGETSASLRVTITVVPATPPATCRAGVDTSGAPQVDCRAPSVVGGAASSERPGSTEGVLGYRLPDPRTRMAGAVVEVGEESFYAWGEYSSRMIIAGGREYVEMTVTW